MKNKFFLLFFSLFFSLVISLVFIKSPIANNIYRQILIKRGYWPEEGSIELSDFGERGKDIAYLQQLTTNENTNVLGVDTDQKLKIAFIGDSFVWANGVAFSNSVSQLLEKRLMEKDLSVDVLSFAMGGDSMLDNFAKVDILERNDDISLYIILVVANDLLLRPSDNFYESDAYRDLIEECKTEYSDSDLIRHPEWGTLGDDRVEVFSRIFAASFKSDFNKCIFSKSLDGILEKTKDKKLLFVISEYGDKSNEEWQTIFNFFREKNIPYLDPSEGKNYSEYSACFENEDTLRKCFWVTNNDRHPSEKLHQMYTDLLLNYINIY